MQTIKQLLVLTVIIFAGVRSMAQSNTLVSNRYKALEISLSDCLNFQAEAKWGIKPIYGVFGIGNQFIYDDYHWAFGLGLGTHILKQDKQSMNLEYIYYHVNQNELWTDQMNSLQQFKILYSRRIGEIVSVFGGPIFNLNIYDNEENSGRTFVSTFPPYDMFTNPSSTHTTVGWIGFTLGLRFDR